MYLSDELSEEGEADVPLCRRCLQGGLHLAHLHHRSFLGARWTVSINSLGTFKLMNMNMATSI